MTEEVVSQGEAPEGDSEESPAVIFLGHTMVTAS